MTVAESNDVAISKLVKELVPATGDRVLGNRPLPPMTFHPILLELIKRADGYTLSPTFSILSCLREPKV
ncbi:hypothetical protein Poly51_63570 [Rubripirellula tenax]|uniref:Uncharacterized protein n=1 Tax=Rubripirellula tenax TaxID=2528015 RepID=A0A5C6E4J7_9BACT|nr:hypothetical protein Poly51_63570 [Rubripirellula tenax]